jgi:hypothetical protein
MDEATEGSGTTGAGGAARTPADPTGLRAFVFGDRPIDDWPPADTAPDSDDAEPWASFVRARAAHRAGDREQAASIWLDIASRPDIESRHRLQAWHFLRDEGRPPAPGDAKTALGAVAEVAVPDGHDLLAAYADGSVRYLNVSGAAVVVDDVVLPTVDRAGRDLLDVAQRVANAIGPWEEPELPPLPAGHTRITVLTPSGPHLGQGPDDALRDDPMAAAFLAAATALLVAVTDLAPPPT